MLMPVSENIYNKSLFVSGEIPDEEAFVYDTCSSPAGDIVFCSDSRGLARLWFAGRNPRYDALAACGRKEVNEYNESTRRWLEIYFSGREPDFMPCLSLYGSAFRTKIWEMLLDIPFGGLVTYGELARAYAVAKGMTRMSSRAVGQAVGSNPVSIIVPCHRVVGSGNRLTGYDGGMDKKQALLSVEGIDTSGFRL